MEPSFLSLLPPLIAIGCALIFRRVVAALLLGVALGATVAAGFSPLGTLVGFFTYLWESLDDLGHLQILAFAGLLGALLKVVSASGGSLGMARAATRFARSRRSGQLVSWLLGIVFFFDDYANALFVGSSMRPITDRLRISREKLAFIIDTTAAPVASLGPISTWIVVEIGYIADQCRALGIEADAYLVFLKTIPSRFYPIVMLALGLLVALSGRDFGPMARAERRALAEGAGEAGGEAEPQAARSTESGPARSWTLAAVPVAVVLVAVLSGLYLSGRAGVEQERERLTAERNAALVQVRQAESEGDDAAREQALAQVRQSEQELGRSDYSLLNVLGNADSSATILWASFLGGLLAIFMAVSGRAMTLPAALRAWLEGGVGMVPVMAILLLAWSLGLACEHMKTAAYLVGLLGPGFEPGLLPAVIFLVAALISFATGTSWGTMGLMFPLAVPLAHKLAPGNETLFLASISSILAGSVFGDHCSPVSDTTILSAMAANCDQVAHVRTQLPYAVLGAAASVVCGAIPVGLGWVSTPFGLLLSVVCALAMFYLVTRKPSDHG
jgi:Na+/H+ antiporter NhaC